MMIWGSWAGGEVTYFRALKLLLQATLKPCLASSSHPTWEHPWKRPLDVLPLRISNAGTRFSKMPSKGGGRGKHVECVSF